MNLKTALRMLEGKGPEFKKRDAAYKELWNAIEEYADACKYGEGQKTMLEELDLALKIFTEAVEKCAIKRGRSEGVAGVFSL